MDIKITPGSRAANQIEETSGVDGAPSAVSDAQGCAPVTPGLSAEAVARVTVELRTGALSPNQAVDRLVSLTLEDPALACAPSRMKSEIAEVLRAMLETDPRLTSLLARLGVRIADEG
ncbi:MAG: hypothetical protein MUC50_10825 [Myxococcota bacterium]|jgi:hypothetical protein|nr:hypothetical protein [Myxococcota bacterium]